MQSSPHLLLGTLCALIKKSRFGIIGTYIDINIKRAFLLLLLLSSSITTKPTSLVLSCFAHDGTFIYMNEPPSLSTQIGLGAGGGGKRKRPMLVFISRERVRVFISPLSLAAAAEHVDFVYVYLSKNTHKHRHTHTHHPPIHSQEKRKRQPQQTGQTQGVARTSSDSHRRRRSLGGSSGCGVRAHGAA